MEFKFKLGFLLWQSIVPSFFQRGSHWAWLWSKRPLSPICPGRAGVEGL